MTDVLPFRGIHYSATRFPDISNLLAPPYDVLSEEDKQALLQKQTHNFVDIDLPHTPPKQAGPTAAYERAAQTLNRWLDQGVLEHDEQPAFYVYHQTYRYGDQGFVRRMFFGRLRVVPFGEGGVFPHEQTFGGPKEDRLLLTQATKCNLSPIFGLYQDAENEVMKKLDRVTRNEPDLQGRLEPTDNKLWRVTDEALCKTVTEMMASKPVYIADGHHRYGTSMLYKEHIEKEQGALPADHPANFVLCCLCSMEDPGLLILPTHRVLDRTNLEADAIAADDGLVVKPVPHADADKAIAQCAEFGPLAMVFCDAAGKFWWVHPKRADILDDIAPDQSAAWRQMGVAVLHSYILPRIVQGAGAAPSVQYIKNSADAVDLTTQSQGCSFLLQANTMQELRDVSAAGDLMPQKSTFFYPKLASGMLVNPLFA